MLKRMIMCNLKRIITVVILSFLYSCIGSQSTENRSPKPLSLEDSLKLILNIQDSIEVLELVNNEEEQHFTFIDYTLSSQYHKDAILPYLIDKEEKERHRKVWSRLASEKVKIRKSSHWIDLSSWLGTWKELKLYENKIVHSAPCDVSFELIMTDSCFYLPNMEEDEIAYFVDISATNSSIIVTAKSEYGNYYWIEFFLTEVSGQYVYIINIKGVNGTSTNTLAVQSEFLANFPIVQHVCDGLYDEYEFDMINFDSIPIYSETADGVKIENATFGEFIGCECSSDDKDDTAPIHEPFLSASKIEVIEFENTEKENLINNSKRRIRGGKPTWSSIINRITLTNEQAQLIEKELFDNNVECKKNSKRDTHKSSRQYSPRHAILFYDDRGNVKEMIEISFYSSEIGYPYNMLGKECCSFWWIKEKFTDWGL